MRIITLATLLQGFVLAAAFAGPATVTTKVNLRSGPGTSYQSLGLIPEDAKVDLAECDAAGGWCAVTYQGTTGFVSGKYVNEEDTGRPGWPRSYTTDKGAEIVLYQPQVSSWDKFTDLSALVATEYKANKDAKPVFGVIGLTGKTQTDPDAGEVVISDIKITQLDFSALDRSQLADFALEVGKLLPTGSVTVTEERLTASLADYQRMDDAKGLKSDPPPIFISKSPAVLLQTDGEAVVAPVKGAPGLSFVVNTNWDLFKIDADQSYFLRDEKSWLAAKALDGDWQTATALPDALSKLPDEDSWKDARAAMPPAPFADGVVPKVVYSDTPSELINFDGEPKLEPVAGTGLEWASNSDGDVFFQKASGNWYVLISGRWFSAKSLDGPWTFATPDLPEDFQNIPDDAPYASVRSSVPKTSENAEARLKASIPQMARVLTDGSVKVDVAYSGDPKFEPIEGTSLKYAVNTNETVIQVGAKYFVLKDGVWFVGDSPTGPFVVATAVPDQIYTIPASSPVYNATYVRVYSTEPGAVWYGYTMGYLGAYLAWDALVYGTGWYYPDYWDTNWHNGYWPYYPRPVTYGVGAFYNPARGTFGRYGYAYGPYRGIVAGAGYNPRTGTYIRGAAVAGPAGERGFIAAYNPRTDTGAIARGGTNVYGSWGSASVRHGSDWARASGGSTAAGGQGVRWNSSNGNHGFAAQGQGGDIYAGRDGNVYRREDGQWQKRSDGDWTPIQKPDTDNGRKPGQQLGDGGSNLANRAQQGQGTPGANRPSQQRKIQPVAPDHLGYDRAGRMAGNQNALARRSEFNPQFNGGNFDRGGFHGGGGFRGGGGGFHGGGGGGRFRR
ncbi:SH3 domain-containing protein [Mesorhizobium yinganensis]|uniref:SH3 domain-containing protein n=1 Tax=Mesorhizobium yinganensis TaxID=3157707 RepID=UPI0032B73E1A